MNRPLISQQGAGAKSVTASLFSRNAEERFVKAFERLVDHITKAPTDERTASWLESTMNAALGQKPAKEGAFNSRERMLAKEVFKLEHETP